MSPEFNIHFTSFHTLHTIQYNSCILNTFHLFSPHVSTCGNSLGPGLGGAADGNPKCTAMSGSGAAKEHAEVARV